MIRDNWLLRRGVTAVVVGPLFLGFVEALCVGADPLFAGSFYGTAAACGGLILALLLWPWGRRRYMAVAEDFYLRWLAILSWALPGLVIFKFLLFRNLLGEHREQNGLAWLLALLLVVMSAGLYHVLLGLYQQRAPWWLRRFMPIFPLLPVIIFVAQLGIEPPVVVSTPRVFAEDHPGGTILLIVDTLRADALAAPGLENVASLKQRARDYSAVYSQASWTRPTVASIMTGKTVSQHHVMSKTSVLGAEHQTLAELFRENGYTTLAIANNANLTAEFGFAQGFDEYHFLAHARYFGAPESAAKLSLYNFCRLLWERFSPLDRDVGHFYQPAEVVSREALALLDRAAGEQPFFLYLHYMDTHDPYFGADGRSYARVAQPFPPVSRAAAMRQAYLDEVRRFDRGLGQLLAGLAQRGLAQKVRIILTADHGEEFAEHGGFYHGTTLYNEQLLVPLLLVEKTPLARAEQVETVTSQADIFSIIADWHGFAHQPYVAPAFHLAEEDHQGQRLQAVINGGYKLIHANKDNPRGLAEWELYDLATDGAEKVNLAAEEKGLVAELAPLLAKEAADDDSASEAVLSPEQAAQLRALGYME